MYAVHHSLNTFGSSFLLPIGWYCSLRPNKMAPFQGGAPLQLIFLKNVILLYYVLSYFHKKACYFVINEVAGIISFEGKLVIINHSFGHFCLQDPSKLTSAAWVLYFLNNSFSDPYK